MKMLSLKRTKRFYISIFCAITLLALTFTIVGAIKYTISTNDSTGVSEWFDQSIPVFQTDIIEGDPLRADEDIVNAWIATGVDNQLYFMVEMAGNPAINKPDQPYNGVGVWLDCNADGDIRILLIGSWHIIMQQEYTIALVGFEVLMGMALLLTMQILARLISNLSNGRLTRASEMGLYNCQTQINVKFVSVQAVKCG